MSKLFLTEVQQDSIQMKDYVNACFIAMDEISQKMGCVMDLKEEDPEIDNISRIYERNYIINLACNFNSIIKLSGFVGGELPKSLGIGLNENYSEIYASIRKMLDKNYNRDSSNVFPDFLIHESHSPENLNRTNQHLIIEAKTNKIVKKEYFYLDFLKLNFYLENLNYDNAIYLIVNNQLTDIECYLNSYMEKVGYYHERILESLYFFVQNDYCDKPKIYMPKTNE